MLQHVHSGVRIPMQRRKRFCCRYLCDQVSLSLSPVVCMSVCQSSLFLNTLETHTYIQTRTSYRERVRGREGEREGERERGSDVICVHTYIHIPCCR